MKRWWTVKEKEAAVFLYKNGYSMPRIGRMMGRNYSSVRYVLHKSGVQLRPARRDDGVAELSERIDVILKSLCPDCLAKVARIKD